MEELVRAVLADAPRLAAMAALALCSAACSASETALFSLGPEDLRQLRGRSDGKAARILELLEDKAGLLISILFANLLVNVLLLSISSVVMFDILDRLAVSGPGAEAAMAAWSMSVLAALVIFCEVVPKALAYAGPMRAAAPAAVFVAAIRQIFRCTGIGLLLDRSAVWMNRLAGEAPDPAFTAEELKSAVENASDLTAEEREVLKDIMDLSTMRLGSIMVPRVDVIAVQGDEPVRSALEPGLKKTKTRVLVYGRNRDDILGYVNTKDLYFSPNHSALCRTLARPAIYLPSLARVTDAFVEFTRAGAEIAVVVDEYGGTAGIVTREDFMEAVLGDIGDEFDSAPREDAVHRADGTWLIDGEMSLSDFAERFRDVMARDPVAREKIGKSGSGTVAGLVTSLLGRVPSVGDRARVGTLELEAASVRNRRVREVVMRRTFGVAGDGVKEEEG
jgi:putative hemolysin